MIDFLSLMYDLYNYYIFMFVFFVCAVVSYYKKKQTLVNTTIEKAMLLFGIFMMGLGCSIIIWWIPASLIRYLFTIITEIAIRMTISTY